MAPQTWRTIGVITTAFYRPIHAQRALSQLARISAPWETNLPTSYHSFTAPNTVFGA